MADVLTTIRTNARALLGYLETFSSYNDWLNPALVEIEGGRVRFHAQSGDVQNIIEARPVLQSGAFVTKGTSFMSDTGGLSFFIDAYYMTNDVLANNERDAIAYLGACKVRNPRDPIKNVRGIYPEYVVDITFDLTDPALAGELDKLAHQREFEGVLRYPLNSGSVNLEEEAVRSYTPEADKKMRMTGRFTSMGAAKLQPLPPFQKLDCERNPLPKLQQLH